MNSEVIQHPISQRRGEQRRAEGEKVRDELGQKIVPGHLVCPFFCSCRWTVHLQQERHEISGFQGALLPSSCCFPILQLSTTFVTSSHFPLSVLCPQIKQIWILTFLLECDSQGPLVSGGPTWAQTLGDEDSAHHDAHEAHGQPQGTDHSLCQLWHRGWNFRLCESEVVELWIQCWFMCNIWGQVGGCCSFCKTQCTRLREEDEVYL